jgi:acetoin:2,6-dichlorophenolindophenol oxidoreductase subunit alpha
MATKVKELVANATPNSSHPNPLISDEKFKQLYSMMLQCRLLGERARILKKQKRFKGDYYAVVGQEATAVGAGIDLRPHDAVAPAHRDFILDFIQGVPLTALFNHLYGRSTSLDRGRSASAHCEYPPLNLIDPAETMTERLKIGTRIALANQMKKNDNVVVAFSGEDSTALGFWHDALNFAGARNLPIVFVYQNSMSMKSDSGKIQDEVEDTSSKAVGYGFPGITVDGNDAVAMYRVAQEAIERARSGGGPTLIEAKTYRCYGRPEIDPANYRSADEVEDRKSKDPIATMEVYLTGKGLFTTTWKKQIAESFRKDLDAAVEVAESDRRGKCV